MAEQDLQIDAQAPISFGPKSWVTFLPALPFSLVGAIFWLAAMLGVQWLVQWGVERGQIVLPENLPDFVPHACVMLGFSAALIVAVLVVRRRPLWTVGVSFRRLPGDLAFALVAMAVAGAIYLLAGLAVRVYFGVTADAPEEAFRQFLRNALFSDLSPGYILGVVLFYPVFEELWFRGVLYPPMRRELGRIPALIIGALLFALAHNNAFPINQFFGGLVFGIAFEMRRSLVAPILLHIAGNGALAAMAWLLPTLGVV